MFSDLLVLIFSVIGIASVFYSVIFRITASLTDNLNVIIPIHYDDENIHRRIYHLMSFLDFCHIKKRCTVVLVNHGASENYCDTLRETYSEYPGLVILAPCELSDFFKE